MTPTTNTQAVAARREIGKWLNEGTDKPVDRLALAQLCAGFDVLARPQEVAAGGFDELIMRHGTTGVHQHWFTRTEVLAIVNDLAASRAPEAPAQSQDHVARELDAAHAQNSEAIAAGWKHEQGDAKDAERLDALEAMVRNSQPCGINIGLHGDGNIYIYLDISRAHAAPRRATLREAIDAILASKGGAGGGK